MPTQEIPHEQWAAFLGKFADRHYGWDVKMEQQRPKAGRLIEAEHGYLQKVLADRAGIHDQIAIVLGSPYERSSQTHLIQDARHIRVAEQPEEQLEIEADDGSTTVLHLQHPKAVASGQ